VKKPCLICGVPSDGSRCPAHQVSGWSAWRPAGANGYGSSWERIRRVVLDEEPDCRICGAPATDVDHILNRARGGSDDRSNLRSLCSACHRGVTSSQGGRAATAQGIGGAGSNGKRGGSGGPLQPGDLPRESGTESGTFHVR
jgi:5-methylcytosine-specific restriction protein A